MRFNAVKWSPARLTLITGGPECSLCEVAKAALADFKKNKAVDFELDTINIRVNSSDFNMKEHRRLWQYDIPVLLFNGQCIMKHRIDEDKLERLLKPASTRE